MHIAAFVYAMHCLKIVLFTQAKYKHGIQLSKGVICTKVSLFLTLYTEHMTQVGKLELDA